jgi:hypothetical protein
VSIWLVYRGAEIEGVATLTVHSVWLSEEGAKTCSDELEAEYTNDKTHWSAYEEFDVEDAEAGT